MSGRTPYLSGAAVLLAALAPAPRVQAGDYHDGATLDCAECHVMHPSDGVREMRPLEDAELDAAQPEGLSAGELLRERVNDLCLSCHDDSTRAADVLGTNRGASSADVRQAGSLNRLGVRGLPATGHTLDSLDVAPGSEPPWRPEDENGPGRGLSCINCHAPHGSLRHPKAYRNLRSDAGNNVLGEGLVTYNHERANQNDLSRDVFVRRARDYDESAVDFNEPDRNDSAMGRFCAGCHGTFHGAPSDPKIGGERTGSGLTRFLRHPTAGVDIGARGQPWSSRELFAARANRVKVMSDSGVWDGSGSGLTPTCITCHKAHGNGNAFGLIYRSGAGRPTEDGDTRGADSNALCGQCHGQASSFSP